MAKRPKPEEIVAKLRQADVLVPQGQSVARCTIGASEVTYPCRMAAPKVLHLRLVERDVNHGHVRRN